MAADSAYTLADFESRAESTLKKGVIRTWREKSPIMERLPWVQHNGLDIKIMRTKDLPEGNAWLDFDEALPNMRGTTEPYVERVHKLGGKIDVPEAYTLAASIVDERANQEQMALEGFACDFNDAFVNGDPTSNSKSLVGLWYRFNHLIAAGQTVLGAGYDISPNTAVTDWYFGILDKLEELRSLCEGGDCDAFLLDGYTHMRIEAALRRSGLLNFNVDNVGRRFMTYGNGGPIFIPSGYKSDQATRIIGHVETDAGTALTTHDATSIYALKFGEPYLSGFYLRDINVEDKGRLEDGVNMRTVVDWYPGIYHVHPRAMARLVGIIAV
jgi:hypothetical protein